MQTHRIISAVLWTTLAAMSSGQVAQSASPSVLDLKGKNAGLKFIPNTAMPRFDIQVSGDLVKALLPKGNEADAASGSEWTSSTATRKQGDPTWNISNWRLERILESGKATQGFEGPNNGSSIDGKTIATELMPVEAIQVQEDGTYDLLSPREYSVGGRLVKVGYDVRVLVSFITPDGKVHTHGSIKRVDSSGNPISNWEPRLEPLQNSSITTYSATAEEVKEQDLLPLSSDPAGFKPDPQDVQQLTFKTKILGATNYVAHILRIQHYDEWNINLKLSTEWRDKSTKLEFKSDSLFGRGWKLNDKHWVGMGYLQGLTDQAFSNESLLIGLGLRSNLIPLARKPLARTVSATPEIGSLAKQEFSERGYPDNANPSGQAYYSTDELTSILGLIDASIEAGHQFAGNPDVQGGAKQDIIRFRLKTQSPRLQLGSSPIFLQGSATTYFLPFPRYSNDKAHRTVESLYEADLFFKTNKDTALKVGFSGGANPAAAFDHSVGKFSFGMETSFKS